MATKLVDQGTVQFHKLRWQVHTVQGIEACQCQCQFTYTRQCYCTQWPLTVDRGCVCLCEWPTPDQQLD